MIRHTIYFAAVLLIGLTSSCVLAQSAVSTPSQQLQVYDCTGVKLDEVDPQSLTKAEQLALLDGALLDSVDRYSSCMNQVQSNMSSGGNAGNGAGNGSGAANESAEGNASDQALEESDETAEQPANESTEQVETLDEKSSSEGESTPKQNKGSDKSKLGVVKPKDNDAIICQILYDAIASEQDPVTLEGLKGQYKDYKCGR